MIYRKRGDYYIAEYDSIVNIFWGDTSNHERLSGAKLIPENGMTLDECYTIAVNGGYKSGVITVVEESPFSGTIYRYGNHGDFWEEIGTVDGYA